MIRLPLSARPTCVALAAAAAFAAASAQTATPRIVVTGNPLGREAGTQPAEVLSGDALLQRRGSTLGATLDTLPGVAASGFGPNASRPVIRGLDGDRIRVLDNGVASVDASSLSFDHALPIDPLVVERVEVLRGPAALLYGGNATGGVVQTFDNRIPRATAPGLSGRAEIRLGGASRERSTAALAELGAGSLAAHLDLFERRSEDLRVPTGRVANSAAAARGGALGVAWRDADGHAGVSLDSSERHYGVVVDPEVTIRMRRERLAVSAERRLGGAIDRIEVQAARTRYGHDEIEGGGAIGTRFRSRGSELRLTARHAAFGPLQGVVGLQAASLHFEALGAEAFVPATQTRAQALFALEELRLGSVRLSAGFRAEQVRVRSAGDAPTEPANDLAEVRFGPAAQRRFAPRNASLAVEAALGTGWAVGLQAGRTERAPASYELFANGAHVASGAYERGDPMLGVERGRHLGASLVWKRDGAEVKASVFRTRFASYIALDATGREIAVGDGGGLPEYRFRAVRARLQGGELEARWRLVERPWQLTLAAVADQVRGNNLDDGQPLPRLAPWRAQLSLEAAQGGWTIGLAARHHAAQRRVPATDTPTPGFNLVDASARYRTTLDGLEATWFARADNLGNRLATNAVAIATVRALSPAPGRAVSAGLRLVF